MPLRWLPRKTFFSSWSSSWPNSSSSPDYPYERLADDMAGPHEGVVDGESRRYAVDAAMAKRVLRKIDMRLIPLLFITYGLNFMDKTILSSASVFGLRNDTVRTACLPFPSFPPFPPPLSPFFLPFVPASDHQLTSSHSTSSASNTRGCPRCSISAICSGRPSPTN